MLPAPAPGSLGAGMAGSGWAPPRLDGFILTERLGSGTYATVYKAYRKVGLGPLRGVPLQPAPKPAPPSPFHSPPIPIAPIWHLLPPAWGLSLPSQGFLPPGTPPGRLGKAPAGWLFGWGGGCRAGSPWQRDTREVVAIKCVSKKSLNRASVENLLTEIEILKTIRHPHIVELKDFQVGLGASSGGTALSHHPFGSGPGAHSGSPRVYPWGWVPATRQTSPGGPCVGGRHGGTGQGGMMGSSCSGTATTST